MNVKGKVPVDLDPLKKKTEIKIEYGVCRLVKPQDNNRTSPINRTRNLKSTTATPHP